MNTPHPSDANNETSTSRALRVDRPEQPTALKTRARLQQPAPQNEGISPAFLWRVFCQWWPWALPAGVVLATVIAGAIWFLHVPMYEAKTRILIKSSQPYVVAEAGVERRDGDQYVQTQIEMLRSPKVLDLVMANEAVASMPEFRDVVGDPVKHLQEHLSIRQVGKSELYEVTYQSPSANDAATIANQIVDEYMDIHNGADQAQSKLVIGILETEGQARKELVAQLRDKVIKLAKKVTGRDPFAQGNVTNYDLALSPAADLYQELNATDVNIEVLEAEIQALQDAPAVQANQSTQAALLELDLANRPEVRELQARIGAFTDQMLQVRTMERRRLGETYEDDPRYQELVRRIEEHKLQLTEVKETLRTELAQIREDQKSAERKEELAAKNYQLAVLKHKRDLLARKLETDLAKIEQSGADSAELELAKAELAREQKVLELIASRKLALKTEQKAPPRLTLDDPAKPPMLALEPIPWKLIGLACAASLAAPFGLALAREITAQRICDSNQLSHETLLPVLGEVARFPVRPVAAASRSLPPRQQREMFVFAESIDSLRTNLMLIEEVGSDDGRRVIAMASAASGEGKTSIATALVSSIAHASKKPTLLIDADLRSPDVANVLGVPNAPGLAEVLAGKATLDEAIHRIPKTQIYVLPAGSQKVNPHHVLHDSKINKLFNTLRPEFSTILVDMPPVLGASESLVYAAAADLVVLCALSNQSRAGQVRDAVERLQSTGANLVGGVLSGAAVRPYAYSYGYEYDPNETTEITNA